MIAAYLRVSTPSQDLQMQHDAIARICRARRERVGVWVSEKLGGAGARDGLTRLMDRVRDGEISKIYVWRLDRLSRGGILEVFTLIEQIKRSHCGFESVSEGFALDHPYCDVALAIMASFAQLEREAIRARLAEARIQLEADGGAWGRPRAIDRPTLVTIHRMRKRGDSIRAIAIALKIPRSTIANHLSGKTPPSRDRK